MNYYFIDFENIKSEGLTGIKSLHKQDKVLVLYSKNANKLEIELVKDIFTSSCQISFVEIEHLGKNSLDFQLCTLLGYIIGGFRGTKLNLFIVSKDKGYDSVINGIPKLLQEQLKQKNIKIHIEKIENLKRKKEETKKIVQNKKLTKNNNSVNIKTKTTNINSQTYENIKNLLKNTEQEKNIGKIIEVVNLVKDEKNLSKIHNALTLQFKEDGKKIYIKIRPELRKLVSE